MNNLQIINEQEVLGKQFRVYGTPDEPLFLAKDVAEWIEHTDARKMVDSIDDEEKLMGTMFHSGQNREMWFLTEEGLYEVLMLSRKPIAKDFKKKVKEILKTIRKTGTYSIPKTYKEALTNLLMEVEKNEKLMLENSEMKPKAIFADAVSTSHTSILVGDLAKLICQNGIEIGQQRLFKWLRSNGYLIKDGNSKNMPTQRYIEQGLFEVKESTLQNPDGSVRITRTTKVTGKGQVYFVNKFLNA